MASAAQSTRWQRIARRVRVPLGFITAVAMLWFARPTPHTLLLSLVPVLAGLWLRGYAAGYVKKNAELTRTGPYAHTRNPLYLGSMSIAFGFAVAAGQWPFGIALVVLFVLIYGPTIRSEETFLRASFSAFDAYAASVPRLLPRITPARFPDATPGRFDPARYRHHREYNAFIGAAAIYAALMLRMLVRAHS